MIGCGQMRTDAADPAPSAHGYLDGKPVQVRGVDGVVVDASRRG
jgi:hypothetical protein